MTCRALLSCVPLLGLTLLGMTPSDGLSVRERKRELAAIEEHSAVYEEAFNRGDVETMMTCYADPYYMLNAQQPRVPVSARAAMLKQFFQLYESEMEVTSDEIRLSSDGRFAVQRGEVEQSWVPVAGGDEQHRRLRYVEFLEKDEDGHWLVVWGLHGPIEG